MQMSRLIKEGGNLGVGVGAEERELNKDVSRPDREEEGEGVREERHAWKVIKAA